MCSPYSSSTIGKSDTVGVCGTSSDQGFWYELGPGETIVIGQSSNTFDSRHTLRYGGTYPGDNEISCVDDPDYTTMTFTNTGASPIPVYFVVDGFETSSGEFVLEWNIQTMTIDLMSISRYDKLTTVKSLSHESHPTIFSASRTSAYSTKMSLI